MLRVADLCELIREQLSWFESWEGWLGKGGGGLDISASLQELFFAGKSLAAKCLLALKRKIARPICGYSLPTAPVYFNERTGAPTVA